MLRKKGFPGGRGGVVEMEISVREKPIGLQDRIIISPIVMTIKCIHTIL